MKKYLNILLLILPIGILFLTNITPLENAEILLCILLILLYSVYLSLGKSLEQTLKLGVILILLILCWYVFDFLFREIGADEYEMRGFDTGGYWESVRSSDAKRPRIILGVVFNVIYIPWITHKFNLPWNRGKLLKAIEKTQH